MEKEQITRQVFQIFETTLKHQNFTPTETLSNKNIAGYDSMAQINIIAELEKQFNIRFQLKELAKITSIDSIVKIIQEKLP
jgi:acyl carrier protein